VHHSPVSTEKSIWKSNKDYLKVALFETVEPCQDVDKCPRGQRQPGNEGVLMLEGYRGIIPPIVTPFHRDGSVDEVALRAEIDFHLSVGVDGICVTGTSGEGHTLNKEDSAQIARITVDQVAGRVPVIAGIIQNSTAVSVEFAEAIAETGVHGFQITPVH